MIQPGTLRVGSVWRRWRTRGAIGLCFLALSSGVGSAHAGDRDDVRRVIDQYMAYETRGDMVASGELMLEERSMVYPGGRTRGNNREGLAQQQAAQDAFAAEFPGVHYEFELRNVEVEVWNADSAMATFETVPTRIVPPSLPPEKVAKLGAPKIPLIVAAMLVKQQGAWKIAHTTFVPRDKD